MSCGEVIFAAGQKIRQIGIVLSGKVMVERDDYWGQPLHPGSGRGGGGVRGNLRLSVPGKVGRQRRGGAAQRGVAAAGAEGLTLCPTACPFHRRILQNLLEVTANKNRQLSLKLEILSRKTTREKLLAYLSYQAGMAPGGGKAAFVIPFTASSWRTTSRWTARHDGGAGEAQKGGPHRL